MKQFFLKFFGIVGQNNNVAEPYWRHIENGWDTLNRIVNKAISQFNLCSIALFVLKLLGYFNGSWIIVFLPLIVDIVLTIIKFLVDAKLAKVRQKIREESYEKYYNIKEPADEYDEGTEE